MDQLTKSIRKALYSEYLAVFGGAAPVRVVEEHLESPKLTPHTAAILRGLSDSHWLGAKSPTQAMLILFSSEIHKYELSQSLITALQEAGETVRRYQEFFNSATNSANLIEAA